MTLEELEQYPWDFVTSVLYGVINEESYQEFMKTNEVPKIYSAWVSGNDCAVYTALDYAIHQEAGTLAKEPYIRVEWVETAREATRDWIGKMLPWLRELANGRPLRLVIGFDS